MKKVTLLIVLMMMIALTTYAAEVVAKVTGEAKLTFGIDLETQLTGFKNENSGDVTFTLVSGDTKKGAEEDVYGYIEVTGWGVTYDSDNNTGDDNGWAGVDEGDLTAKIIFPNGWVKISGTNSSLNYLNVVQDDDKDNDNADKGLNDSLTANGGLVLGLNFAPVAIEVGVFSQADWTADNGYGVNIKATVDVAPIKIEGGFEVGLNHSDTGMGAGAKISANIAPITVYAATDITIDTATVMEFGGGLSLAVAGITLTGDVSYNESLDGLDVRAKVDAGGMVPNLGLSVTVELFNILGNTNADDTDTAMEYAVIGALSYTTPQFKPYVNVRYGSYTHDDDHDTYSYLAADALKINIGVEMYLITNVTFTLDYNSDNIATNNGLVKFITKIAL